MSKRYNLHIGDVIHVISRENIGGEYFNGGDDMTGREAVVEEIHPDSTHSFMGEISRTIEVHFEGGHHYSMLECEFQEYYDGKLEPTPELIEDEYKKWEI